MSRQPSRSNESGLVTKFLGADAASGGPFAILGVDPTDSGDEAVLLGLRDRLEQASRHPEGATPEADEIRLALHAAAAQLLDTRTRESMLLRWGNASRSQPHERDSSRSIGETDRQVMLLQHDAVMAIAACGGWNERARARLMMLAQARGFSPDLVHLAVSKLESRASRTSADPTSPPQRQYSDAPVPVPALPAAPIRGTSGRSRVRRVIPAPVLLAIGLSLVGVVGVLSIVAVVAATGSKSGGSRPAVPSPDPAIAATNAPAADTQGQLFPTAPKTQDPEPSTSIAAPATTDAQRLVQRLNAAVAGLSTDSESAVGELAILFREAGVRWVELEGPDLAVVQRCFVDVMYQAEDAAAPLRFIESLDVDRAVAMTRVGVLRTVWQTGILARLSRERDLPATIRLVIEDRLARLLSGERPSGEPAFEAGAIASLLALADSVAAEGSWEPWGGWLASVEAIAKSQPTRRTDLLLAGLTGAMEGFTRAGNARLLTEVAAQLSWHREPAAQRWLIARFDGLDTPKEALVALTRALASKSSVPGIDATMALAAGASEAARRELRDRYAEVFGLDAAANVLLIDARLSEVVAELSGTDSSTASIEDSIRDAVAWSRVSEAAWLRWRGVSDRASSTLDRARLPDVAPTRGPRQLGGVLRRDETPTWTRSYLNAGSDIGARTSLLGQYPMSGAHPADAEIVLGEALRGSPVQVRESARLVVEASSTAPIMVNAMLEALPTAPRTLATAEIIAALTGRLHVAIDGTEWRIETRRLLVERLLELLAAQGAYASIDSLSSMLADSHAVRALSTPDATPPTQAASVPSLEVSLAQERDMWRIAAEEMVRPRTYPDTLAQIESGTVARSRVSSGVIQRVVVAQHEIVRLMGHVIASERPDRAIEAWAIVSRLNEQLAIAPHVGSQVRDCEMAMAQLWVLRIRREVEQ